MALHVVHALAAALWIGTLGAIVLAPLLGFRAPGPRIVSAFSRLAQTSVVLLVAAGGVLTWQYVGGAVAGRLLLGLEPAAPSD